MEVELSSRTSLQIGAPIVLEHVEMICEYIANSMYSEVILINTYVQCATYFGPFTSNAIKLTITYTSLIIIQRCKLSRIDFLFAKSIPKKEKHKTQNQKKPQLKVMNFI